MAGEDIHSWSTTAADNGNSDTSITWVEHQARASVNNSARSTMAAIAKERNLLNGTIVTTGAPNAQAFLSGRGYTTIPTGLRARLKVGPGLTNIGPTTLNMDGLGAIDIKVPSGHSLLGNELVAGGYIEVLYDGTNWISLGLDRNQLQEVIAGGPGIILAQQVFTTPGAFIYTPHEDMRSAVVECVGGGGAGAGANAGGATGQYFMGGGGGAGGYSRKIISHTDVAAAGGTIAGLVGSGGVGWAGNGGVGTASNLGTLCKANGGSGGLWGFFNTVPNGGAGASIAGAIGDIKVPGGAGGFGFYNNLSTVPYDAPGYGASGPFGGGAAGTLTTGMTGPGYGSGGSGGGSWNTSAINGGSGAGGVVIITEFGGVGAPGPQGPEGPQGPAGPAGAGSGDVLVVGTPVAGQYAQWTDSSHIQGVASTTGFSTGDAKLTLKTTADLGWVMMDDGTIGNAASGGTTRANADTQDLFILLWTNIPDTWCPVLPGGRGATALADFTVNKTIQLPRQLGRALAGAGAGSGLTSRVLGSFVGEESHTPILAEMVAHTHLVATTSNYAIWNSFAGVDNSVAGINVYVNFGPSTAISLASAGSSTPFNVMQPTAFWNVMIKL